MTAEDLCGCALENEWSDEEIEAGECLAESEAGTKCSRPTGHDGPHTGCSIYNHPKEVFEQ